MSTIVIKSFESSDLESVREIFFESSTKKEFESNEEKEKFFWKYLGFYLTRYPQYAWVGVKDSKVLGYILGAPSSMEQELLEIQPHMKSFIEEFKRFPAHLHINCHADSRGLGLGSQLVGVLEEQLSNEGCLGLHIMTGPESRNRSFYLKAGFNYELSRSGIHFMGKLLR